MGCAVGGGMSRVVCRVVGKVMSLTMGWARRLAGPWEWTVRRARGSGLEGAYGAFYDTSNQPGQGVAKLTLWPGPRLEPRVESWLVVKLMFWPRIRPMNRLMVRPKARPTARF